MRVLKRIEEEIFNLSSVDSQENIKQNKQYMDLLAKKKLFDTLIEEIIDNYHLLEVIAKRSYEHVNHFDKIVIIDSKDTQKYRLTIHYWNPQYSADTLDEELIHNHRFSFWSHVYRGNLHSQNFVEGTGMTGKQYSLNKFKYLPAETGNIHDCFFEQKEILCRLEDTHVNQGHTYYLDYKTTHRIILPKVGQDLCTFVLRGPRKREYTNTYNTFYPKERVSKDTPMMTPEALKSKLLEIIRK